MHDGKLRIGRGTLAALVLWPLLLASAVGGVLWERAHLSQAELREVATEAVEWVRGERFDDNPLYNNGERTVREAVVLSAQRQGVPVPDVKHMDGDGSQLQDGYDYGGERATTRFYQIVQRGWSAPGRDEGARDEDDEIVCIQLEAEQQELTAQNPDPRPWSFTVEQHDGLCPKG
ncbi:hypothetical protein [Streptomyces sp. NPDC048142]|uniref:hypothetical protein n=1 Tax=Streptomyces sp. NPDC048142 TaxID=3365501 RepID=UPI0037134012